MNEPNASTTPAPLPDLGDWRTVNTLAAEINQQGPILSTHALRHYVAQSERNGLEPHIRRLGRKILISRSGFAAWLNGRPTSRPIASARR